MTTPDTVLVFDVDAGIARRVTWAEAAAGHQRFARSLGPGTAAAGVGERRALEMARNGEESAE